MELPQLDFRLVTLEDADLIRCRLGENNDRLCDMTGGDILIWRDFFQTEFLVWEDSLLLRHKVFDSDSRRLAYIIPTGTHRDSLLRHIVSCCGQQGNTALFSPVSEEGLALLEGLFEVQCQQEQPNYFDYLYESVDLATLSGRRYNRQRNHINKFRRLYPDAVYEEIGPENTADVRAFLDIFYAHNESDNLFWQEEKRKLYEVLENYETYGFTGGAIRVGDALAAVTMGEVQGDTLYVHVEKGNLDYAGIYQVITHEFAAHNAHESVRYINREEDMGDPGLRFAKQSNHPVALIKKYIVEVA